MMIQYSVGANFVLFVTNWLWNSGKMKGYPDDIWTVRIWTVKFPGDIGQLKSGQSKVQNLVRVTVRVMVFVTVRLRVSVRFRVSVQVTVRVRVRVSYDCPDFDCHD